MVQDDGSPSLSDVSTVFVKFNLPTTSVQAIAKGPFKGATFVEQADDALVFSTDATFRVKAQVPETMASSYDLVIDVYADGVLLDQQSAIVSPGQKLKQKITVPVNRHNLIEVRSWFVQAPNNVEGAEQNVLEFEFNYSKIHEEANVTIGDLQNAAKSGAKNGFKSLFGDLVSKEAAIPMILQNDDSILTNEQAAARYDAVQEQVADRLSSLFHESIDEAVDEIFKERGPIKFRYGQNREADADAVKHQLDRIPQAVQAATNNRPFLDSLEIKFIERSELIAAVRGPLQSRFTQLLNGETPAWTNIEEDLAWQDIKFIKEIGVRAPFDLTPNQNNDAQGTLYFGTNGFSYSSFTEEWRTNNKVKFGVYQPVINVGANFIKFQGTVEVDMEGEASGAMTFEWTR